MLGKFLINWCARRDCSRPEGRSSLAFRSGPPSLRAGVQLGLRPSCRTQLVVCWEFELCRRVVRTDEGFSGKKSNGAPGEIRTPGLLVRSQALYPTELRARKGREYYHKNYRAPLGCNLMDGEGLLVASPLAPSGPPFGRYLRFVAVAVI